MARANAQPKLGRGLAALLGESGLRPDNEPAHGIQMLPVDRIDANPFQPRTEFDQNELESLADSIRVQGVLQPLLVRRHPTEEERYQIVAGERRFRAATMAGLNEVPAMRRELDDSDAAVIALVENLQRQDLNVLEEAEGFHRLMGDFGLTQEALGLAVSKSRSHIGNTIRLLRLSDGIKRDIRVGSLTSGHARALLNAPDPEVVADQVVRRGLSVRQTEALVARMISARGDGRQPAGKKPDIADLEQRIGAAIGCRVTISATRKGGGEISIQFRDAYQLDELIQRLTRELAVTGSDA